MKKWDTTYPISFFSDGSSIIFVTALLPAKRLLRLFVTDHPEKSLSNMCPPGAKYFTIGR